jgi:hypothetical protein
MVKGPGQRRCSEAGKGLLRRAPPTVPASLTGRWVRPIHSALVWQGFGRLRREAHVSAEQRHPQAAARVPRAHGDRRRPARDCAAACQRAQAPVLLSVATQLQVRLGRMRGHIHSGGPPQAAPRIPRRGGNALPLGHTGVRPAGGPARRARGDRRRLHRQPADRRGGGAQPGAAPAPGGGTCRSSRCRQARL